MRNSKSQNGFVLFVALLTASLLLAIGMAVVNLTLKSFTLATEARESQYAFYAADAGAECALYWDLKTNLFSETDPAVNRPSQINCNAYDENRNAQILESENRADIINLAEAYDAPTGAGGTRFDLYFLPDPYCVSVTIHKSDATGVVRTTIESRGYNIGDPNPDGTYGVISNNCLGTTDSRRVERELEVMY